MLNYQKAKELWEDETTYSAAISTQLIQQQTTTEPSQHCHEELMRDPLQTAQHCKCETHKAA